MAGPEVIDLRFQGTAGVIAGFLFAANGELGLIESGPASTLDVLLAALEPYGGAERLTAIAVSHVHLDHAGAVGRLMELAPHAVCYVHAIGRRHLVDPSRLVRSATMIYGDRMDALWGQIVPAPEDRVVGVEDGNQFRLGGSDFTVVYTPGHAIHHMALLEYSTMRMFTGDVAGVKLRGVDQVRPPTPPPDLDPLAWRASVAKMRELKPSELLLTHFGPAEGDISRHLDELLSRLDAWVDLVTEGHARGSSRDVLVADLTSHANSEMLVHGGSSTTMRQFDLATPFGMTVDGILYYLSKEEKRAQDALRDNINETRYG